MFFSTVALLVGQKQWHLSCLVCKTHCRKQQYKINTLQHDNFSVQLKTDEQMATSWTQKLKGKFYDNKKMNLPIGERRLMQMDWLQLAP